MAKVKIQGNASGTGVVTLTAPNTNADRTHTLPDVDGTLVANTSTGIDVTGSITAVDSGGSEGVKLTANESGGELQLLNNSGAVKVLMDFADWDDDSVGNFRLYHLGSAGDLQFGIPQASTGYLRMYTNGAERMTVNSAGNVGIGTSSPTAKLDINNSTGADLGWDSGLKIERASGQIGKIVTDSEGMKYRTFASGSAHHFRNSSNATTMKIDSAGRVTMPYQPAYVLTLASDTTLSGNIWHQVYNQTVPVTGQYLITWNIEVSPATFGTWVYQSPSLNGTPIYYADGMPGSDGDYRLFHGSCVISAGANDTVGLRIHDANNSIILKGGTQNYCTINLLG